MANENRLAIKNPTDRVDFYDHSLEEKKRRDGVKLTPKKVMSAETEPTRSAETPTKVFELKISQTKTYRVTVAAESAEQARKAWEESEGFEYTANNDPDYEEGEEQLTNVVDSTDENAEIDFEEVCGALDLPYED